MKKEELLASLAERTKQFGIEPPSQSKLESWISKKLMGGATGKGVKRGVPRDWSYSEEDVRRAHTLVELEARGFKRTNQLFLGVVIEGFPLDPVTLRKSLSAEAIRSIKRMRRNELRNFVASDEIENLGELSDSERRLVENVDPVLRKTGYVLPPDYLLAMINSAVGGTSENLLQSTEFQEFLKSQLKEALPSSLPFDASQISYAKVGGLMAGILGLQEETDISIADRIESATNEELLLAAQDLRALKLEFEETGEFARIASEPTSMILRGVFQAPDWLPLMLAISVSLVQTGSNFE